MSSSRTPRENAQTQSQCGYGPYWSLQFIFYNLGSDPEEVIYQLWVEPSGLNIMMWVQVQTRDNNLTAVGFNQELNKRNELLSPVKCP